jgi:hypothetical protein
MSRRRSCLEMHATIYTSVSVAHVADPEPRPRSGIVWPPLLSWVQPLWEYVDGGEEAANGIDFILVGGGAGNRRRGGVGGARRNRRKWMLGAASNPSLPLLYGVDGPRWGTTTSPFALIGPHLG